MDSKISKEYIKIALWLSIAISILEHFSSVLDEIINTDYIKVSFIWLSANIMAELIITFLISFLLFIVNYYLLKPNRYSRINKTFSVIIAFMLSFILMFLLGHYLFMVKRLIFVGLDSGVHKSAFMFRDFITALAVVISVLVIRIINQNNQNRLEIQNLKIENLQRQFDALKNQISPHFLFNSLNSLKTLIRETPDIAQEYLNQLASVLRYTLQANENKLVSVQDELKFIESYFFLVKIRFGNNIQMQQQIKEKSLLYKMPPFALQILIENAIKHNEISKRNPLEIIISETPNDTVLIKNNINQKLNPELGTGLGLANLTNQYRILSGKEISISKDDSFFIVELPLLKK